MPVCKKCNAEIDWIDTKAYGFMPVDPGIYYYEECNVGDRLITLSGQIYRVEEEESFPNVKGQVCHWDNCKAKTMKVGKLE